MLAPSHGYLLSSLLARRRDSGNGPRGRDQDVERGAAQAGPRHYRRLPGAPAFGDSGYSTLVAADRLVVWSNGEDSF